MSLHAKSANILAYNLMYSSCDQSRVRQLQLHTKVLGPGVHTLLNLMYIIMVGSVRSLIVLSQEYGRQGMSLCICFV